MDKPLSILYCNGLPRSGTTLLLSLLKAFPSIAIPGGYPYELRVASYLASLNTILCKSSLSTNPWSFESSLLDTIAEPFPFCFDEDVNDWHIRCLAPAIRRELANSLQALACQLIESTALSEEPIWWVEKFPSLHEESIRDMFGNFNLITLIRDPIDITLSRISANINNIGSRQWIRDAEIRDNYVILKDQISGSLGLLEAEKEVSSRGGICMLIKYDSLITEPYLTLKRLGDKLGISLAESSFNKALNKSRLHQPEHETEGSRKRSNLREMLIAELTAEDIRNLGTLGYTYA